MYFYFIFYLQINKIPKILKLNIKFKTVIIILIYKLQIFNKSTDIEKKVLECLKFEPR